MCVGGSKTSSDGDSVNRGCGFDVKVAIIREVIRSLFGNGCAHDGVMEHECGCAPCRLAYAIIKGTVIGCDIGTGGNVCGSFSSLCEHGAFVRESATADRRGSTVVCENDVFRVFAELFGCGSRGRSSCERCPSCGQSNCGSCYGGNNKAREGRLGLEWDRRGQLDVGRFTGDVKCNASQCDGNGVAVERGSIDEAVQSGLGGPADSSASSSSSKTKVFDGRTDASATPDVVEVHALDANVKRGKNWAKNKARRELDKQKRSLRKQDNENSSEEFVPEWRRKLPKLGVHVGVFSECDADTRRVLRESRAKMLVARNELEAAKALAAKKRVDNERSSKLDELKFELDRLKHEKERRSVIQEALAKLPVGYEKNLVEIGVDPELPSLLDRSISPDSSISVAEVNTMLRQIDDLKACLSTTVTEFSEVRRCLESQLASVRRESELALERERKKHAGGVAGRRGRDGFIDDDFSSWN